MTLVVKDGSRLMPVIRKPNFSDVTDDLPIDTFRVRVGNQEEKAESKVIPLREYLSNLSLYTDNTHEVNLVIDRDSHVLTSSQCCVIPVQRGNTTEFAVQLFNYQSYDEDPAVLVVLVSKDGVSTQVIQRSNQKLFFNDKGSGRWFTLERHQDYKERKTGQKQEKIKSHTEMSADEKQENVIMMIQIPLKQKERPKSRGFGSKGIALGSNAGWCGTEECMDMSMAACAFSSGPPVYRSMNLAPQVHVKGAGMDMGMIGLGSEDGPFIGTKNLELVRDDRFPIRCTFQFYRGTDENFVAEPDVKDIADQLAKASTVAKDSGSLVTNTDTGRVTEPDLTNPQPSDTPFGKLEERDYLKQVQTQATQDWGTQSMATFM
jgi:hypothetical protein